VLYVDKSAAGKHRGQSCLERMWIEVEDALRRHDPLRPTAVELVLAADLLAGMRDVVDPFDQPAFVVGGEEDVGVAHAHGNVVDADSARSAERHLSMLAG